MGEFWYLWLIFILIVIVTIIVWKKALNASKKRQNIIKKQIADIENEKFLRNTFRTLTKDLITSSEMPLLLDGVCANIQRRLEKAEDMNKAFEELSLHEKYVYTLKYFVEDSKDGLSEFFKKNGEPLISLLPKALEELNNPISTIASPMFAMFDEENENTSYNENEIKEMDKKFAEEFDINQIYQQIKFYIELKF